VRTVIVGMDILRSLIVTWWSAVCTYIAAEAQPGEFGGMRERAQGADADGEAIEPRLKCAL